MSQEAVEEKKVQEIKLDVNSCRVDDPELVAKYDQESQGIFFIPDSEKGTYDEDHLMDAKYVQSAEKIGGQLQAIVVTVWDEDPKRETEDYDRVHMRVADGRHRYFEAKSKGQSWSHVYYRVSSFQQYMMLRAHFDSKKKENVDEKCMMFKSLAKHIFETTGMPQQEIGNIIVKMYSPTPYSATAIREYLPPEFKDSAKSSARLGKTKDVLETKQGKIIAEKVQPELSKKLSAKEEKIQKLETLNSDYVKQLTDIKDKKSSLEKDLQYWKEWENFLSTEHVVTVGESTDKVSVRIDKESKNIIVKRV